MRSVKRSVKQKVFAAAAVAVLLGGGALAAVSATGQTAPHKARHAGAAARAVRAHDLMTAAGYLGVSVTQLESELRTGKTLAQVASGSGGKSAAGLIEALVAAKKAKLSNVSAKLPRRVSVEVNRAGGPGVGVGGASSLELLFANPRRLGSLAAGYLGVSAAQLQTELHAGRTLAQVADATAGKSQAGLIDALVAAKRQKLGFSRAAGKLTQAKESKRLAKLSKRVNRLVQRRFAGSAAP
jgi:hypothetical protein